MQDWHLINAVLEALVIVVVFWALLVLSMELSTRGERSA